MAYTSEDYKLADALVTAIAAALPAYPVSVVGDPRADRKSITAIGIRVRPAAYEQQLAGRSYDEDVRKIHVGIIAPCLASDLTTLDGCLTVCDLVRALWGNAGALRFMTLSGHDPLGVLSQSPIYDEPALLNDNLFVGTITVSYHRVN